nr:MAG: hypothetical protein DIU78_10255 [Pseudomonadota bacterium]
MYEGELVARLGHPLGMRVRWGKPRCGPRNAEWPMFATPNAVPHDPLATHRRALPPTHHSRGPVDSREGRDAQAKPREDLSEAAHWFPPAEGLVRKPGQGCKGELIGAPKCPKTPPKKNAHRLDAQPARRY